MDVNCIKNKLITHMNYSRLPLNMVKEIQSSLLGKYSETELATLLERVERHLVQ
jgi:hypothetical protein